LSVIFSCSLSFFVVREQIWVNPGFQEQLVLYELCQYAPSPSEGIYIKWRTVLDGRLASVGLIS
jgi:dual specificity phosphatase 12